MNRRDFITLLGGTAAARPLAARAQRLALPVVGVLWTGSGTLFNSERWRAFHQGLGEVGYVEDRNVAMEYSWADDEYDRLPALAAELVRRRVAVIVTSGGPAAFAAKAATASIPIVFQLGLDPVASGLVASLNHPGGNATGATNITASLVTKRLQLVRQLAPTVAVVDVLTNPTTRVSRDSQSKELETAAHTLGIQLRFHAASTPIELDAAFADLVQARASVLLLTDEAFFMSRVDQIVALAARLAVPVVYTFREFAAAGGLMSYASNLSDSYRQVGVYVGRILGGEKPGDMPVVQPTRFELVINLTTAKALGLTVTNSLLASADEVIE
jgi:putative ABC transport system substrate-binding protein